MGKILQSWKTFKPGNLQDSAEKKQPLGHNSPNRTAQTTTCLFPCLKHEPANKIYKVQQKTY